MKFYFSKLFTEKVLLLNEIEQKELKEKLAFMAQNSRHQSLRNKKIKGTKNIFEASIIMNIRMTWQYYKDGILLRNIGKHDETLKNP